MRPVHPLLGAVDSVMTRRVSLARRFYYLGSKQRSSPVATGAAPFPMHSS